MRYGKLLHEKNYIASADGNISVKNILLSNSNSYLVTRSGVMKGFLQGDDILEVDESGAVISPNTVGRPSSEISMHLQIYKNQPLAKAVIHAHPPSCIAFTVAFPDQTSFPMDYISELRLALGEVPVVPYQRPGTDDMGKALIPFLNHCKVLMLARHGLVSWGESLEEAYRGIERMEHACDIYMRARAFGEVSNLPENEIEALKNMRQQIGFKTL